MKESDVAAPKSKEGSIIFSPESVRAIMAGLKTQTRRVIRPQPPEGFHEHGRILWESFGPEPPSGPAGFRFGNIEEEEDARRQGLAHEGKKYYGQGCPYGRAGDRLWCRESWSVGGNGVFYRADTAQPETVKYAWNSPRFMKRKDSRLVLEVVAVRVERVQEITEKDCEAEGIEPHPEAIRNNGGAAYRYEYAALWEALNAKRGFPWESNCWVWVVEFKVAKA